MRNGRRAEKDDEAILDQRRRATARAQTKRRRNPRRDFVEFVNVPIWWASAAAKAAGSPAMLVCVRLLHLAWKANYKQFTVPNGWLVQRGVSRDTKARVLRELEKAKLISIDWGNGRAFRITMNVL
jgi:hypothetical protein